MFRSETPPVINQQPPNQINPIFYNINPKNPATTAAKLTPTTPPIGFAAAMCAAAPVKATTELLVVAVAFTATAEEAAPALELGIGFMAGTEGM